MTRTRIGILDDHQMFAAAILAWIRNSCPDLEVVAAVSSWADLMAHPEFPPDVVLLDLDLGDNTPPGVKISSLQAMGTAVVVVSGWSDPAVVRSCVAAGALGYVPKTEVAEEISLAVRSAAAGELYLTPELAEMLLQGDAGTDPRLSRQEARALALYASGLPLKSVARQLDVTYETAKSYLDRVRAKYALVGREAHTKVDLRRRAVEDGLLMGESHGSDQAISPDLGTRSRRATP